MMGRENICLYLKMNCDKQWTSLVYYRQAVFGSFGNLSDSRQSKITLPTRIYILRIAIIVNNYVYGDWDLIENSLSLKARVMIKP